MSNTQSHGHLHWDAFSPRPWTEDDIDIKGTTDYPCCVGHEIIGTVIRVGQNVTTHRLDDRVGVGAQALSCLQNSCPECAAGAENYCQRGVVFTWGGVFETTAAGGKKAYGGVADRHRVHARFAVGIPEKMRSEHAAPLMCAGATVYAPLKRYGCGQGMAVGVVGVGGVGHLGILFARAMGAERVVMGVLGADEYIATGMGEGEAGGTGWVGKHARRLDLILCTVSGADMPINEYLALLKPGGTFVLIGAPDGGLLPSVNAFSLIPTAIHVAGSVIGSPGEIKEMLEFAAEKNIIPWIETRPLAEVNQAIDDMGQGKARYRYVLVNEKNI
ncbi:hypothetical protein BJX64DRAFT_301448 [Aspergillus heterothallicus]